MLSVRSINGGFLVIFRASETIVDVRIMRSPAVAPARVFGWVGESPIRRGGTGVGRSAKSTSLATACGSAKISDCPSERSERFALAFQA